ncbi:hypothetical protein C9374_009900 [Naegleria lovaniensis]|uniref:Uncharacterized protein n=1 Tax=Naegleria lovaniensis TaxID=51637 RepID=A0AA88KJV5_NAELO|nr:uncharacterized protein C9374_009900 [Naegleria lovaniensis]KAG2375277.1 hypothetical protein C9374_009900 [Naegleria lovaniensis]
MLLTTKEIVNCTECPSRTFTCSHFYDPDSPSNAIDYSQLATFVFPKCKAESHTHSNVPEVMESEEDVITNQDVFIEQEEFSVNLELDFSSEDEDNYSQQQDEFCISQESHVDDGVQFPNNSYKFLTYPKLITLFLTLFLVWLQRTSNHTILTLSTAIMFVVILSIFEHQSRANSSLSKANAQLQSLILQTEGALQS